VFAAVATGQQRPDLCGIEGVVQDDQQPPPRHEASIQRGRLIGVGRRLPRLDAQPAQQPAQCLADRHRRSGVIAAQVHVQLAVRYPVDDPVAPLQRQRGLAGPGRAADRQDTRAGQRRGQPMQFGAPPGETGDWRRQLRRSRRRTGARRSR
jgi:hypothetical protein